MAFNCVCGFDFSETILMEATDVVLFTMFYMNEMPKRSFSLIDLTNNSRNVYPGDLAVLFGG